METIEVVSAVVIRGDRILLTQRRPEKDFPFAWECPGGKVEGDESHHAALTRELEEEIGGEVAGINMTSLWCDYVRRPDGSQIFLLMYLVEMRGVIAPREGQGLGWFRAHDMNHLELTPGNGAARDKLRRVLLRRAQLGAQATDPSRGAE